MSALSISSISTTTPLWELPSVSGRRSWSACVSRQILAVKRDQHASCNQKVFDYTPRPFKSRYLQMLASFRGCDRFKTESALMGQKCHVCGKTPQMGNSVAQRGKPKYLGGNGRKTTGISRRSFKPNLQKVRIQEGSSAVKRRVCTQCLRSGKVQKAVVRQPFTLPDAN